MRVPEARGELSPDRPFLILACDGLWEVLSPEEAVEIAARCLKEAREVADKAGGDQGPRHAALRHIETALGLGTSDNVIVVLFLVCDG